MADAVRYLAAQDEACNADIRIGSFRARLIVGKHAIIALRQIETQHGVAELARFGAEVARRAFWTLGGETPDIDASAPAGTIEIADCTPIGLPSGGWWASVTALPADAPDEDGLPAALWSMDRIANAFGLAIHTLANLPNDHSFGEHPPSDRQLYRLRRMMAAGLPVPTVAERSDRRAAAAYLTRHEDTYLRLGEPDGAELRTTEAAARIGVPPIRLWWWLLAHGYLGVDGRPTVKGEPFGSVSDSINPGLPPVVRWKMRFVEGLVPHVIDIAGTGRPTLAPALSEEV